MKNLLYFLVIILLAGACQPGSNEFKINGTLAGADSGKIFLVKAEAGQPVILDTCELVNNAFEFAGSVEIPEMHFLRLGERTYFAQFFLENSKILVDANKDSLRNTKIAGSETQDLFQLYLDEIDKLNKESANLRNQYNQAMVSGNTDNADKAKIDYDAMVANMDVYAKNFISENRNSVVAPFIYLSQFANKAPFEELDTIVNIFPEEIQNSLYVTELKKIIDSKRKTAIGTMAPDFTQNDTGGNPFQMSSLRGNYLLIDFWASWCAPCRQENPNVVALYKKYHDKGFNILGVSLDRNKEDWLKGIEEDGLTWKQVYDQNNKVATLYGVKSIPHTILLDKEGRIIAKNLRGEELKKKLEELLGD